MTTELQVPDSWRREVYRLAWRRPQPHNQWLAHAHYREPSGALRNVFIYPEDDGRVRVDTRDSGLRPVSVDRRDNLSAAKALVERRARRAL